MFVNYKEIYLIPCKTKDGREVFTRCRLKEGKDFVNIFPVLTNMYDNFQMNKDYFEYCVEYGKFRRYRTNTQDWYLKEMR